MPLRIEDYAMIGDCHTAALVGNDGSIDWLCFPRFDSGACFAALLGTADNGRWLIAPDEPVRRVTRRYRPGTLILETTFETEAGGVVELIDFMPPRDGVTDLVRIVRGVRGRVKMRLEFVARFDYGSVVPWVRHVDARGDGSGGERSYGGIRATAGPDTLFLRSPVALHGQDLRTCAEFVAVEGERVPFSLVWQPTHLDEQAARDPVRTLAETERFWLDWSGRCSYRGPYQDAVCRSLITLKGLTYLPTGGVCAAATTSLPEHLGGIRNWDYRFCWLRDASFTLQALIDGGYIEEATAWRQWLVNAVAGDPAGLQIMYGLGGERRLTEMELPWLAGYAGSRPVRMGNEAYRQRQMDVYGEVIAALHAGRVAGLSSDDDVWRVARSVVNFLCDEWPKPDAGIWEMRGPERQYTHSKVMAWTAFDRAVKAIERFGRDGDANRWRAARDAVKAQVLAEGYNPKVKAFTQTYGSAEPDASLLMLPMVGFLPADDPRMVGTVDLIERELVRDGFVERYRSGPDVDGMPPGEGSFLLCTFWLADNLALQGKRAEATEVFERLLSLQNDVGLLSEQYDPRAKRMLGNFPQAFSHVGLVNTARYLNRCTDGAANDGPM